MIDLDDAFRTIVGYMEQRIVGIGYQMPDDRPGYENEPAIATDLGLPILSRGFFNKGEKAGRVNPAPPDPKWIKEHVPGLAFWPIGFAPKPDYHLKKKWIDKNFETRTIATKIEYYRARILMQAEMNTRSNMERTLMLAQISHLFNTDAQGTGRLKTLKGDYVYLKLIESRQPQEPEYTEQGIYRLVMTWELRVRDYITTEDTMLMSAVYTVKYGDKIVTVPNGKEFKP